jgi:hypothetical protein
MESLMRAVRGKFHMDNPPQLDEVNNTALMRTPIRVVDIGGTLHVCYRPDLVADFSSDESAMRLLLEAFEGARLRGRASA